MNRRYTRAHYLELVNKLRSVRPDVGLTSDIIVGFPGETEAQFEDTLSLVREVRYDSAFTFIYSRRAGTRAAQMPDPTPQEEKTERIQRLIALQTEITSEILSCAGRQAGNGAGGIRLRARRGLGRRQDAARTHGQFPGKRRPHRQIRPGGNTLRRPQHAARKTDHGGLNHGRRISEDQRARPGADRKRSLSADEGRGGQGRPQPGGRGDDEPLSGAARARSRRSFPGKTRIPPCSSASPTRWTRRRKSST